MRAGVFLCQCGGNISGVLDLDDLAAHARAIPGVSSVAINQFMCGTEGHDLISAGRRGPRARPPDRRQLLAAVPGPDLRAHRPRAAAGRERRGLRQPARGLQLHPQGRARARPGEGPQDPRGRDRPGAAPERPAAAAHVPHALGARGRRRHRRHDRRRGARRQRHRRAHGRAPAQPGRLHGAPQQDLPDRGLRHVQPGAAPHEHRPRGPGARPHPDRGRRDRRPARRVPRQAAPQAALRQRGLRGLRRVRAGLPGAATPTTSTSASASARPSTASSPTPSPARSRSRRRAGARARAPAPCTRPPRATWRWSPPAASRTPTASPASPTRSRSVCGRICTHLCETACARGKVDEPVAIAALKRFVADEVGPTLPVQPAPVIHEERVAVVGAGPAGITCARDLADLGYRVTVFEAQQVAGGMLRTGIPDYRLPHDVIQREVDQVLAKGIELKLGQRAGTDFTVDGLFEQGYKAVYLATGLQKSAEAPLPGDDLEGVTRRRRAAARAQPRRHAAGRREDRRHRRRRRRARRRALRHPPAAAGRQGAGRHAGLPAHQGRDAGQRRPRSRRPARRGSRSSSSCSRSPSPARTARSPSIKLQRCELGDPDESGRRQPVAVEG